MNTTLGEPNGYRLVESVDEDRFNFEHSLRQTLGGLKNPASLVGAAGSAALWIFLVTAGLAVAATGAEGDLTLWGLGTCLLPAAVGALLTAHSFRAGLVLLDQQSQWNPQSLGIMTAQAFAPLILGVLAGILLIGWLTFWLYRNE